MTDRFFYKYQFLCFFFYIYKMEYDNMRVIDFVKERGLRGYSKLREAELITFLQNNLQPIPAP